MRVTFLLLASTVFSTGAEPDPNQVLARMTAMVRDQARRVPNYTCSQTVDQIVYYPKGLEPAPGRLKRPPPKCDDSSPSFPFKTSRSRMEVRYGQSGEMYSWPGDGSYDYSLTHMLGGVGLNSTGSFAAVLQVIFADSASGIRFTGEESIGGEPAYRYSFSIPEERSRFLFNAADGSKVGMAYEGTISANRRTGAPARVLVTILKPAAELRCCRFSFELAYRRVRIGGEEFLLPFDALQAFYRPGGGRIENAIALSSCREFRAESRFVAGDGTETAAAGAAPPEPVPVIPAGLPVSIRLSDSIDSATAAIGDAFTGRLDKALVDSSGNEIAPAGALVRGRVTGAERMLASAHVLMLLAMESIEIRGRRIPVGLIPRRDPYSRWPDYARDPTTIGRPSFAEWPAERQMVFRAFAKRHVIPAGTRTEWVTAGSNLP